MIPKFHKLPIKQDYKRKCRHCGQYNTYTIQTIEVDKEALKWLLADFYMLIGTMIKELEDKE